MRYPTSLLLSILFFSNTTSAQEMHGFELRDGVYHWVGHFTADGMSASDLVQSIAENLSLNSFVVSVKPLSNNRIAGKVDKLPEPLSSTGVLTFSFGYLIECFDGEYVVTTKDWVGTSGNPMAPGMVARFEDMLNSPLVGRRRKENLFKAHEEAQVKMFQLP